MGVFNFSTQEANNIALGQGGVDLIDDTSAHTGNWVALEFIADTVIDSITIKNSSGTFTGRTWQDGRFLFGVITDFTLTSGVVLAYRTAE
jgi:hypothetical protein